MEDLLNHPAVQGGVLPFVAGLIAVLVLQWARLGGMALLAAFATTVYFVNGMTFVPLTATRKIIVLGLATPLAGVLLDFAFKPNRLGTALLALAAGCAAVWVFLPVLQQKPPLHAWMLGAGVAVYLMVVTAAALQHTENSIRGGATALVLGLGSGIAAVLAASLTYGLYGIAIGAGAGAFLLVQMISGKRIAAGATLMLPAAIAAGLLAAGAMLLAQLPWYALPALAAIPLATLVPVSDRLPLALQSVLYSLCALVPAGVAFYLSWHAAGGVPG
jgi:hypothetical protein